MPQERVKAIGGISRRMEGIGKNSELRESRKKRDEEDKES